MPTVVRATREGGTSDEEREKREREYGVEMRRRRRAGLLGLLGDLHAGAMTCEECKELGAAHEREIRGRERVVVGLLFPTQEALEAAKRGHLPFSPAPVAPPAQGLPPWEDADEGEDADEAPPPKPGAQVRIVEMEGKPAYFSADYEQWVTLDEEAAARAVAAGWAYDDRPPKDKRGPPSTCVKMQWDAGPPPLVPPGKVGAHLRGLRAHVRDQVESLVDIVRPVVERARAGPYAPGLSREADGLADLDVFLAEMAPLLAAAEAFDHPIILDAADRSGRCGAGP